MKAYSTSNMTALFFQLLDKARLIILIHTAIFERLFPSVVLYNISRTLYPRLFTVFYSLSKGTSYLKPSWNKHKSTSVVENTDTTAILAGEPAKGGKQPLTRTSAHSSLILQTSTLSKYLNEKIKIGIL